MEFYFRGQFQALVRARVANSFGAARARQIVFYNIPIGQVEPTVWYASEKLIESGDLFFGDTQPMIWYA